MNATVQQNSLGHLHVWFKRVNVEKVERYNYHGNGQESDLYLQTQSEIQTFLDDIDSEDAKCILDGEASQIYIPDEWKDM